MKKSRFTETQIVSILKQADGVRRSRTSVAKPASARRRTTVIPPRDSDGRSGIFSYAFPRRLKKSRFSDPETGTEEAKLPVPSDWWLLQERGQVHLRPFELGGGGRCEGRMPANRRVLASTMARKSSRPKARRNRDGGS